MAACSAPALPATPSPRSASSRCPPRRRRQPYDESGAHAQGRVPAWERERGREEGNGRQAKKIKAKKHAAKTHVGDWAACLQFHGKLLVRRQLIFCLCSVDSKIFG